MSWLLAQRARHDGRWQESVNMWCTSRWTFDPVRSQRRLQDHTLESRGKASSIWRNKGVSRNIRGICVTCGKELSGDLLTADCEDLENSASDFHVKWFKHQEVVQEGTLLFPCADGSVKLFDLPQPPRGEMVVRKKS